jgi:hypothetical protein
VNLKLRGVSQAYHLHCCAIHGFGLQKDDRVRVADAGQQQSLGSSRAAGNHHLQARGVRKVRLRGLRVVVRAVTHSAVRGAEGQAANVELSTATIPVLGRLVDNLANSKVSAVACLNASMRLLDRKQGRCSLRTESPRWELRRWRPSRSQTQQYPEQGGE